VSAAADDHAGESPDEDGDDESSSRHGEAKLALRLVTGPRLVASRALARLTQTDAAKALGYKNSAQLRNGSNASARRRCTWRSALPSFTACTSLNVEDKFEVLSQPYAQVVCNHCQQANFGCHS
jgi:hypothetical protein